LGFHIAITGMNKLTEKIKNIFRSRKKPGFEQSEKPQATSRPFIGADEISKSMRESARPKLRKNLWRNIFKFAICPRRKK
jgi:hypothetical protein